MTDKTKDKSNLKKDTRCTTHVAGQKKTLGVRLTTHGAEEEGVRREVWAKSSEHRGRRNQL